MSIFNAIQNIHHKLQLVAVELIQTHIRTGLNTEGMKVFNVGSKATMASLAVSKQEHPVIRSISTIGVVAPAGSVLHIGCFYIAANGWLISDKKLKAIARRYVPLVASSIPTVAILSLKNKAKAPK